MNEQERAEVRAAEALTDDAVADGPAPTAGDRIVAELGRLAELRSSGRLSEEALAAANAAVGGTVEFQSDGRGGLVIQFGMMPDMSDLRAEREADRAARSHIRKQRRKHAGLPPEPTEE